MKKKKIVYLGMSGGVDSSVCAALLKKNGYDVRGVFIKVWQPDFIECTWKEDRRDAMRICAKLDIPFTTFDAEKVYKEKVIDYMIDEYKNGKTPNPDIFCNQEVKFGVFFEYAIKNKADFVATGHYTNIKKEKEKYFLKKAKDKSKDQTYFLYTLKKENLKKIIFPIGNLLKSEVREIAEKNNLIVAHKKDSQGLCFLGKIDVKDFLKKYIQIKKGKVFDLDSKKNIGIHEGINFYTIGEKIFGKYILEKKQKENLILVSQNFKKEKDLKNILVLENLNFFENLKIEKKYKIVERYHGEEIEILIKKLTYKNQDLKIEFEFINKNNFLNLNKGQALIFWEKDILKGGGIIK